MQVTAKCSLSQLPGALSSLLIGNAELHTMNEKPLSFIAICMRIECCNKS